MPITIQCSQCGKKLQAPDSSAGKRGKCPECGSVFEIPEKIYEAEEIPDPLSQQTPPATPAGTDGLSMGAASPFSQEAFDDAMYGVSGPSVPDTPAEPMRSPCPACGEMIMPGAAKCRYCGEIFDEVLKRKEKKRRRSYSDDDSDLSTGDWILAILCSGIGCIVGIVWLIQGKPKGGKMVGVSIGAAVLWNIIRFMIDAANQGPLN